MLLTLETQLFIAIKNQNLSDIESLLVQGANVNHWEYGYTPLTFACRLGSLEAVQQILIYKQDGVSHTPPLKVDMYDTSGKTALVSAICGGYYDIVDTLTQHGACIDVPTELNQSPIAVALEHGYVDIAEYLLARYCDVQVSDNIGITPLYLAIKLRCTSLVIKVLNNEADVNLGSQDHSPVFLASRLGLFDIVKVLVEAGCDKNVVNKFGVTPLYESAAKGHLDIVKYLITHGAEMDKADMYQVTPLIVAAMLGHLPVVKALVENGANVRMRDDQQRNALYIAMEVGHSEVVTYFLTNGLLDINHNHNEYRLQSICRVFERGDTETAEVLLRACSRLPLPHYPGVTDMFRTNSRMMKLLLYSGNYLISGSQLANLELLTDPDLQDFLQGYHSTPLSLASACRVRIRSCLGNSILYAAKLLPLPQSLKKYICLESREF